MYVWRIETSASVQSYVWGTKKNAAPLQPTVAAAMAELEAQDAHRSMSMWRRRGLGAAMAAAGRVVQHGGGGVDGAGVWWDPGWLRVASQKVVGGGGEEVVHGEPTTTTTRLSDPNHAGWGRRSMVEHIRSACNPTTTLSPRATTHHRQFSILIFISQFINQTSRVKQIIQEI